MKRFLLYISISLSIILAVFFIADRYITKNLHHSNAIMFHRWNDIIFDSTYHDIIISGNSRAWHFYNPYVIDSICGTNSYNLGLDGRYISSQIARYNVYLQFHRRPKCVVQSVEHFTLASSRNNKFEREQFLPYFYINSLYDDIYLDEGFTFIDKYIPFVRYIGYRDVIFEGLNLHNDLVRRGNFCKGFEEGRSDWNNTDHTIDSMKFNCDSLEAIRFEKFITRLTQDSISVVFVLGPIYRGAKDTVIVGKEEQLMYDWFYACAAKYGCPVLNYMQLDLCFDTEYFYNATHVNYKGAQIVSEMLAHDLDSLGIIK